MLISIFKPSYIPILASALLAASLFSCQSNKTGGTNVHNHPVTYGKDSLAFRDTLIKEISPYFAGDEDHIDTTYVKLSYPIFQDSSMNKIVKENILLDNELTLDQYVHNFLEGYGNFIEENEVKYSIAWQKETDIQVKMNNPYLIMLGNMTYEFSGGAHGNNYTVWNVYDAQTKQKLPLNTFISENKMKEFTKIAERFFRKEEGLADSSSYQNGYFFENDQFTLAANYGIDNEGLLFYYNPYEIKPYSEGPTLLSIPFDDIQECMTQTGKNYISKIKEYYNSIQ
ncbi:DUF3298 domain-containing protein [Sphingobacterium cellulitidis]|uniref:DUF3298 and DUF4163 domain-containing protein n=1 Tax=Sphingobacterium cellulitidis TaxID=1768011 RepID=UPI003C7EC82F